MHVWLDDGEQCGNVWMLDGEGELDRGQAGGLPQVQHSYLGKACAGFPTRQSPKAQPISQLSGTSLTATVVSSSKEPRAAELGDVASCNGGPCVWPQVLVHCLGEAQQ